MGQIREHENRPKKRADWKFLRSLARTNLDQPGAWLQVYGLFIQSARGLGFLKVGVAVFTPTFLMTNYLGDPDLKQSIHNFQWGVHRCKTSKYESIITMSIHYGYNNPVMIAVLYDKSKHQRQFTSLSSLIRLMYYLLRCNGLEKALHGKDLFVSELTKRLLGVSHV